MLNNLYKYYIKNVLFVFDAEKVHDFITLAGENLGKLVFTKNALYLIFFVKHYSLHQTIENVTFENPIGLAAGFDYNGRLTQILPSVGFGFETIGTVTNNSYEGNPKPRLGRLPKSNSLLVNKGFKNLGAKQISSKLKNLEFKIPIGVSIGVTNSNEIKNQTDAIADILSAFKTFEKSRTKFNYYELNISCPNLKVNVDFYSPSSLNKLLNSLDRLKLKRPIFIKMPIDKNDKEVLSMLQVITKHKIVGVIFGNLLKDRSNRALNRAEVRQFGKGNFSGKPTQKRSNELIKLTYKKYKNKLIIIGCGGVFSAADAYKKIKLGASLVQLVTGLIYEGPLLPHEINKNLLKLLKKDGYKNISDAIGVNS